MLSFASSLQRQSVWRGGAPAAAAGLAIGWGLAIGTLAILGMPPFGVFASEFLILTTAMRQQPWATPILLMALGVAFAAIFSFAQSCCSREIV